MFSLKGPKGQGFKYKFTLSPLSLRLDDLFPVSPPAPPFQHLRGPHLARFDQPSLLPNQASVNETIWTSRIQGLGAALRALRGYLARTKTSPEDPTVGLCLGY